MRVRNFETEKLKVNDARGKPGGDWRRVVWKVFDSAEAVFEVDNYRELCARPERGRLRNLATRYRTTPIRTARSRCRVTPRRSPSASRSRSRSACRRPGSRPSRRASATWRTRKRSPPRCCSAAGGAVVAARRRSSRRVGMVETALEQLSKAAHPGARRRAPGVDGQQPAWSCCAATGTPSR